MVRPFGRESSGSPIGKTDRIYAGGPQRARFEPFVSPRRSLRIVGCILTVCVVPSCTTRNASERVGDGGAVSMAIEPGNALPPQSPLSTSGDPRATESSNWDATLGESCDGGECPMGWDCVRQHWGRRRHCVLRCGLDGGCPDGFACHPKKCVHLDASGTCNGTTSVPGGYCYRRR